MSPTSGQGVICTETLNADVPCASCSYNLRGLKLEGVCPECGMSLIATLPNGGVLSVHRISEQGIRRRLRRNSVFFVVWFLGAGGAFGITLPWHPMVLAIVTTQFVAAGALTIFLQRHAIRTASNNYILLRGSNSIVCMQPPTIERVEIEKNRIKQVVRTFGGLTIRSVDAREYIYVPNVIDDMEAVSNQLTQWDVAVSKKWRCLPLVAGATMPVLYFSGEYFQLPLLHLGVSIIYAGVGTGLVFVLARSRVLALRTKIWTIAGTSVVTAYFILRTVNHLLT